MVEKGQITSERASSGSHATYMTRTPQRTPHQGRYFATSGCACMHLTQGNTPSGSLRVTFHNVISGQKGPLGLILRNFRLCMRTPLPGSRHFQQPWYLYYRTTFCTTIVRKKRGKRLCMRRAYFCDSWFRLRLLPVTSLLIMRNGSILLIDPTEITCELC